MVQYQAKLGNGINLNKANAVTKQYGEDVQPGVAEAQWQEVFDSPSDPNDTQLRIYNLVTSIAGYALPGGGVVARYLAILGRLEFGIGGSSMVVDFDWKEGGQISVAASFVRVIAAYSGTGSDVPPEVRISAMLASGSRAARAQNTRTYPKIHVDSTHVQVFPIPPFAHALNLFSTSPAFYQSGKVQIRYVGGASAGSNAASLDLASWVSDGIPFLGALANEDGVRFPEMARWVEITSADVTGYDFVPCFTLNI